MAGNKKYISSDHENEGQGHCLQKSIYLTYYTNDFNKIFTKIIELMSGTNLPYQFTPKM